MDSLTAALVALGGTLLTAVAVMSERRARRERLSRAVRARSRYTVGRHVRALARRRAALLRTDSYGVVDSAAWDREVGHFVGKVVRPALSASELRHLDATPELERTVWAELESVVVQRSEEVTSSADQVAAMSPAEFERFCAGRLEELGWRAWATGATGDQGADVIAEKGGTRVVLQCKLVRAAVGNKAVQQAFAAQGHYGARFAAVVTTAEFTRSARELAATTGVRLLHHTQLAELDLLAGPAERRAG